MSTTLADKLGHLRLLGAENFLLHREVDVDCCCVAWWTVIEQVRELNVYSSSSRTCITSTHTISWLEFVTTYMSPQWEWESVANEPKRTSKAIYNIRYCGGRLKRECSPLSRCGIVVKVRVKDWWWFCTQYEQCSSCCCRVVRELTCRYLNHCKSRNGNCSSVACIVASVRHQHDGGKGC